MLPRLLLALVSGLGLTAAFEPFALPVLLPFAVAGYVGSVHGLRARAALLPGAVFGIAFYFTHIWWMKSSVGADAWLALSAAEAAFYALLGPVVAVLRRAPAWPLWTAAAWASMEAIRSGWPFSGMPWGRVSYAVVDTPVAPLLPYVGVAGLGFLVALAGSLLAWVVLERGRRLRGVLGLVLVVALVPVVMLAPWQVEETGEATVAAVQGDVPGPGNDILYDHRQVTRNMVEATVDLAERVERGEEQAPDFVLWPENATAVDPFLDRSTNEAIWEGVRAAGVPVLVAAIVDAGESHIMNQGIVWDPVTGAADRYTKRHPVPFGEYIPFRSVFEGWNFGRLTELGRDQVSGTRTEPLPIAGIRVADAICFDIAYEDVLHDQVRRGAELVTVQTSNAMFIHTHQIDQQFAITRLRAIETGRYVAVASPNGLTGIIGPDGSVIAEAEPRTTSVLVERVGLSTGLTPAVRMGAWPARVLALLTLIGLLFTLRSYARSRRGQTAPAPATAAPTTDATTAAAVPDRDDPATELEETKSP
ncbi:apolipoprotein N-acyltransferase [Nocardioides insulae]|uniref:apolipoprotein N-acyltransferase n=1 Tax=Nocardioides insulae TaxID=394734 RepID=UPI0003FB2289|nr:apolipoprotein N-acyltransferase [Nocardioides insulae]